MTNATPSRSNQHVFVFYKNNAIFEIPISHLHFYKICTCLGPRDTSLDPCVRRLSILSVIKAVILYVFSKLVYLKKIMHRLKYIMNETM